MASPLENGPLLQQLRSAVMPSGSSPPWVFYNSQRFSTPPSSGTVRGQSGGAQHWSVLGVSIGSTEPVSLSNMASGMIGQGAGDVYYIEDWYQDGRILGTGFVTWCYIAVGIPAPGQ